MEIILIIFYIFEANIHELWAHNQMVKRELFKMKDKTTDDFESIDYQYKLLTILTKSFDTAFYKVKFKNQIFKIDLKI